jgi:cytosine/adenosine deaminase-related metal-dependent hydrolase
MILEGTVLRGEAFEPVEGRVVVEDGTIAAVEEMSVRGTDIVLPAFVNAHTHLGDSVAKEAGAGLELSELVAPPDDLRHRVLAEADRETIIEAIRRSLRYMRAGGTAACIEFREGGLAGVEAFQEAATGVGLEAVVLARGSVDAMAAADGFGASGADEGDFSRERNATARAGKPFGIHAGEADAGDINPALDLEPDFLVHMVNARELHLERVADSETPVVVCPRSNLVTGVGLPPVRELLDRTTVALGTDNAMLNGPSMFREMEFTAKLTDATTTEILRMATVNGAALAGLEGGVVAEGEPARLQVLDGDSDNLAGARDPRRAVVRRAGVADVTDVVTPTPGEG